MDSDDEDPKVGPYDQSQRQAIVDQENHEDERALDEKFPNRPHNKKPTLPFHTLYQDLFNPVTDNLHKKSSARPTGRKAGPHGGHGTGTKEARKAIIERYFSRWRREVGDDLFPVLRLIIPEKDRERAMYGLKEKALGRYLVKILKIDRSSEDAMDLLNWKLPGQSAATRNAGDFAGRCFEVLNKRAYRIEPGDMLVDEVNFELNELSKKSTEEDQLPILEGFYKRMNPEELMWLIRIILRQMRIGATERTILDVFHPDAESLFNVSSSLRRVCWELCSPNIRLDGDNRTVSLESCYQPQLAHHPKTSFAQMVAAMKQTEDDLEYWIEEKLDGERMQVHIVSDPQKPGGKRFRFWSRKAKDYTYLYGDGFECADSALTKYIKGCLKDGVENCILDGEMITWNNQQDMIVPFGSLKTAAIKQQSDHRFWQQPLYRVFDILLLNDHLLTRYTLRDRRKALEATINNVHRRIETLEYSIGTTVDDIEPRLREVVANASEGLVLKNPRSSYMLDARFDDWVKVKPEYMSEFGESLDCLIIGGYYGTGRRGGELSSFLCGLRADKPDGQKATVFLSFFKFGGGMTSDDFAKLRHLTQDKWHKYDPKNPPTEYIKLGGSSRQFERPDMWIKPEDSICVEVKAASVNESTDYATKLTLRFPRFTRFRMDKDWRSALSVEGFSNLKDEAEAKREENKKLKKMEFATRRKKQRVGTRKKQVVIAGYDTSNTAEAVYETPRGDVFRGLTIYIMTESTRPGKKSKAELEELVKANGGNLVQSAELKNVQGGVRSAEEEILCIAERRTVKVASLEKRGNKPIVKPAWLFDCIKQAEIDFARGLNPIVLPFELERHLFFVPEERKAAYDDHDHDNACVDQHGDSYARDTMADELRKILDDMTNIDPVNYQGIETKDIFDPTNCRGCMFANLVFWFDNIRPATDDTWHRSPSSSSSNTTTTTTHERESHRVEAAKITSQFAGATLISPPSSSSSRLDDERITHIILNASSRPRRIRIEISGRKKLPRVVSLEWVEECWKEHTRIAEERFVMV